MNNKKNLKLSAFKTATLGVLIDALQRILDRRAKAAKGCDHWHDEDGFRRDINVPVTFGVAGIAPAGMHSYRGWYDHLALGVGDDGYNEASMLVEFLAAIKSADGTIFEGYKGGNYEMNLETPVWVANYGRCTNTAIVDVVEGDYEVVLVIERVEV